MPSSERRKRAASLLLFFAVIGSLIRVSRRDFGLLPVLAPLDFRGTSTNFVVCAGMPFVAFWFKKVISLSSYAKTAFGTAVGLSIYEVVQIYLPRRTFDPGDIIASFLGAVVSIAFAYPLFLMQRNDEKNIEPRAAEELSRQSLRAKDEFSQFEEALRDRGISAYRQQPGQLVLSRQRGSVWPDAGNSFWICRLGVDWYVCTWAPYYYRVPSSSSVLDVAEAFVDVGTSKQPRVADDLIARFGLVETDHDEFDRLWKTARPAG